MSLLKNVSTIILLIIGSLFLSNCRERKNEHLLKKDFSKKEIEEDFNEITNIIETKVPFPFYNCPKEQYDSVKQYIKKHIPISANLSDVYKIFYPLIQTLNDAHFSLFYQITILKIILNIFHLKF